MTLWFYLSHSLWDQSEEFISLALSSRRHEFYPLKSRKCVWGIGWTRCLLNGNIFSPSFCLLPAAHSSSAGADDMGVPVVGVIQEYLPQIQHIITVRFSPCLNNHILGNSTVGDAARHALSKNLIPCNWEKSKWFLCQLVLSEINDITKQICISFVNDRALTDIAFCRAWCFYQLQAARR